LTLMVLTSGCWRLASSATVDLTQFTAQPSASAQMGAEGEAIATSTLDITTQNTLRIFPLWVGSTWVYDYLGYTVDEEAHWRVTETVVSSSILDGHYVVEVERAIELTLGEPAEDFPSAPPTDSFYYLVDGENIYRLDNLDETAPKDAWLELILPFPTDEEIWIPDPSARASEESPASGARMAQGPFDQVISGSGPHACYNVVTSVEVGTEEATFCEGIGFLFLEAENSQGEGYRMEMIGFVVQ
ncbi:MAG: hypothetical protein H0S82_09235, partial [Anaerolineaceae bacterium]|nr:hypothetical protein [Anaerolineaceae bacterium]